MQPHTKRSLKVTAATVAAVGLILISGHYGARNADKKRAESAQQIVSQRYEALPKDILPIFQEYDINRNGLLDESEQQRLFVDYALQKRIGAQEGFAGEDFPLRISP